MAEKPRTPPMNYAAEQSLLGSIMLDNRAIDRVSAFLLPEHWADPVHSRLFKCCLDLTAKGTLVSAITLKSAMAGDKGLEDMGGDGYLAGLVGGGGMPISARDYGQLIYDLHLRRELIAFGEDVINASFEGDVDTAQILSEVERRTEEVGRLYAKADATRTLALQAPAAYLDAVNQMAYATYQRKPGEFAGIPTGLIDLDRKLGGLVEGNLYFVPARPGVGKSGLAATIARNVAKTIAPDGHGYGVAIFSLEMGGEEIWERLVGHEAQVSPWRLRAGPLYPMEMTRIDDAVRSMRALPLYVDPSTSPTVSAMRRRVEGLRRRQRVDLILVDYLQLMGSVESRRQTGDNRTTELGDITRGLKNLAKDLGVPVVVFCQLSRLTEATEDKRPQLHHIREAGTAENDADAVIFIYREEYYLSRTVPRRPQPRAGKSQMDIDREYTDIMNQHERALQACANIAELDVAKHRKGPIGTVKVHYDKDLILFGNLAGSIDNGEIER